MATELLINATSFEVRVALVEYGNLVEFHQERPAEKGLVSNIYKGVVKRVLPGMQAAFVDIGLERTGFLYVDDVHIDKQRMENGIDSSNGHDGICGYCANGSPDTPARRDAGMNIEDMLVEGQEILVQICKDPIGTKGARLTCNITLPCRNLVFMPLTDHIGISRRIEDEEVRQRIRRDIEDLRPADTGFIVRTVGENATREDLEADMEFLLHLWDEIRDTAASAKAPCIVYQDLDIALRSVRDIVTPQVGRIVVDDPEVHARVCRFVETFAPRLKDRVDFFDGDLPLFDAYGIEMEINRALDKKIWLRCGGYIIIDTTEALTVIDVNTGRYVGKNDLEETIFKTNMEAVKEIAYQLRLRNIGGIIIIDFIDMESESHRDEIVAALREAVRKDKSRVNILKVSEFGLVQMTRKRNSENLANMLCEPCPYCHGDGIVKSKRTICYEIFRRIDRQARKMKAASVTVTANPQIAAMMMKEEAATLHALEESTGKRITITPKKDMHLEKYDVLWENV